MGDRVANALLSKLSDLLKIAGIICALAAPALTFYTVTKVELAQTSIRLSVAENRIDKLETAVERIPEVIGERLDRINERLARIEGSVGTQRR